MFAKRGLVISVSLILIVLLGAGVYAYEIQAVRAGIDFPEEPHAVYTSDVAYSDWSFDKNTTSLSDCSYNIDTLNGIVNTVAKTSFSCSSGRVSMGPLQEGSYGLNLSVIESGGPKSGQDIKFDVDSLAPRLNFVAPTKADNAAQSSTLIKINISVAELNEQSVQFTIKDSGSYYCNQSTVAGARYFESLFCASPITEGQYTYSATVVDNYGHSNTTSRSLLVDLTAPTISISAPANAGIYDHKITSLTFNVDDKYYIGSCWYSTDNGITNVSVSCSKGSNSAGVTSAEGTNNWKVWVNDTAGNTNSTNVSFWMDSIYPQIAFNNGSRADDSYVNGNSVTASVDVVEANTANITYSLYNSDGSLNGSRTFAMADQNSNTTYTWGSLNDGTYYYNVSITDIVNHINKTETRKITLDTTNPVVSFVEPPTAADSANLRQRNVYALVDVNEVNEDHIIFELHNSGNSLINQTIFHSSVRDMNWTGLSDGSYYYRVCVVDKAGNSACTDDVASIRLINLDATPPVVSLGSPSNNDYFNAGDNVAFTYSAYDSSSGLAGCDLYLNGEKYVNKNLASVSLSSITAGAMDGGKYEWFIECTDNFGNVADTETRNVTILSDLTFPDGTTATDLSSVDDITNVWFWVANEYGIINWTVPLDLSRGLDWADYINLSFNTVDIDSIGAPELNEPARITLYNLTWTSPQILKNGAVCGSPDCVVVSYENGTLVFDVTGFSKYTTQETPAGGSGGSSGGSGGSSGSGGGNPVVWGTAGSGSGGTNVSQTAPTVQGNNPTQVQAPSGNGNPDGNAAGITGAVIGSNVGSYIAIIVVLALIAGLYVILTMRKNKDLRDRIKLLPDKLDVAKHPNIGPFYR